MHAKPAAQEEAEAAAVPEPVHQLEADVSNISLAHEAPEPMAAVEPTAVTTPASPSAAATPEDEDDG